MSDRFLDQESHAEASKRIDETLKDLLDEGVIPDGGIVTAAITVVETMDGNGNSRSFTLFTDARFTMLLGLLQVGNMHVMAGAGGSPER